MATTLERIRLIHEELKAFRVYEPLPDPRLLSKLSRVNIIVGANNSGKSRLLRGISKIKDLYFVPKNFPKSLVLDLVKNLRQEALVVVKAQHAGVHDVNDIISTIDSISIPDIFSQKELGVPSVASLINTLASITANNIRLTRSDVRFHSGDWQSIFADSFRQLGEKYKVKLDDLLQETGLGYLSTCTLKRHYIPILRGLRPFSEDRHDFYKVKTQTDYFKEDNSPNHNISTGIDLYDEIRSCLLGDLEKRKIVNEFQDYLSKEFFENKPVAVIPKEKKQELALKIGREKEQQIYDLGDGLQSLLIISFCIYKARSEKESFHLIFIEEPEIFIHPGLQRLLLKKMLSTSNCQFFFTTHSNHFLDITLDFENISVFRITKELEEEKTKDEVVPNFIIENVSSGDSKTLEILGVRDSSVFLSNCTVWVEGITDRMYLRHYLELYQDSKKKSEPKFVPYKEDTHFSFVEYGGANLVHFDFGESETEKIRVKSITKNVLLVSDKDSGKENKHEKFTEILGENYYPLPAREIENLVSVEILKKTIVDFEASKNNGEFSFKNRLQHRYYLNKYLGDYIEKKMIGGGNLEYSYVKEGSSGTIRDKIAFAKVVIRNTKSWDDLSSYAKDLTKKTFNFIESKNKN